MQHLLLTVRLHDARYHGVAEWPPAPARVFQALLAGAARGREVPAVVREALAWLERLPAPRIAAPAAQQGSTVDVFVPNNDADAVGGDPARIGDVKTLKSVTPWLLASDAPLLYAWECPTPAPIEGVVAAAEQLYQLGRGQDMAWAEAALVDDDALRAKLLEHPGEVFTPASGGGDRELACPGVGTLASLEARHAATLARLKPAGGNRTLFIQPPKPSFRQVAYGGAVQRLQFRLADREEPSRNWALPLARVATFVQRVRDAVTERLRDEFPEQADVISRALIARVPDDAAPVPAAERVRFVPLPSIGAAYADHGIRRLLVEVPIGAPVPIADLAWAVDGVDVVDPVTGELAPYVLIADADMGMLGHYQSAATSRWRSVTPLALPGNAARRRIAPERQRAEGKPASERSAEEHRATDAVADAVRHAGVAARVRTVVVQREPFDPRGTRADECGEHTRFAKERLWHVEVEFDRAVDGPLVLGDGRYLGLGVMAPVRAHPGVIAFVLSGDDIGRVNAQQLARAARRAIMARAQAVLGDDALPRYISGHEADGGKATGDHDNHVAVHLDRRAHRLLIVAPHAMARRRVWGREREYLEILQRAVEGFSDLRAGPEGRFQLERLSAALAERYERAARVWESREAYTVNVHRRGLAAEAALRADVLAACVRVGLPPPATEVLEVRGVPRQGLSGRLRLDFGRAVSGPIVLGRTRHLGGGLFLPAD